MTVGIGQRAGGRLDERAGPAEVLAQIRAAPLADDVGAVVGDDLDRAGGVAHAYARTTWALPTPPPDHRGPREVVLVGGVTGTADHPCRPGRVGVVVGGRRPPP